MKIDSDQLLSTVNKFKNEPVEKGETAAVANDKVRSTGSDRVELSSNSKEMEQLKKTLQIVPDFRSDRVAQLKDRIAAGTYHVEGKAVAAKVLQSWRELRAG